MLNFLSKKKTILSQNKTNLIYFTKLEIPIGHLIFFYFSDILIINYKIRKKILNFLLLFHNILRKRFQL